MTAQLIDGKDLQGPILERVGAKIQKTGTAPVLDLVMIDHPVMPIQMQTEPAFDLHISFLRKLGVQVRPHRLAADVRHDDVVALVEGCNADASCDGVFILVPPPPQIRLVEVLNAIDPAKELEGLHPAHAAHLLPVSLTATERPMIVPATLRTVFDAVGTDFEGAHVVVVVEHGALRANLITHMVTKFGSGLIWPSDTTVTVVHHEHPRVEEYCRDADVLVAVLPGVPRLVRGSWVKPGATVVDFAATVIGAEPHPKNPERMMPVFAGGVDNDEVAEVAKVLCPAPRGVGPVMLALLAENLLDAAIARRGAGGA
ncbi:MAG: bifunctional 5,10-methylenetetrahydrofolate dehydrogenase/5,10-methenyltetrahydrofolate cyclohydrolase [Catenulispora sp.]|nr:bifunctional 5,10-methylenetetrahydrofolate dehydrogenase/5,10-methenyltetrahydrofolate cyclohydrolase [Catenulispora sp.]